MSPSRGALLRLINVRKAVRPRTDRVISRNGNCPIRSAQYSHSISLSLHSLNKEVDIHRSDSTAGESSTVNSSNNSINPDGIEASLFESTTEEYHQNSVDYAVEGHNWHGNPSDMLIALLKTSSKQATITMRELRNLRNEVEHRIEFARAARQCAVEEDYQGCLYWLDIVPNYNAFDPSALASEHFDRDCAHIAHTLNVLTNSRAEPYVVCRALLKIISKGYLEAGNDVNKAIHQTMTWLLRHGRVTEDGDSQKWTWQLWQSFSKFSLRAKDGIDSSASTSSNSRRIGNSLEARLVNVFNGCLRTLCLTGKLEAAILWVKNSQTLNVIDGPPGTRLQYFTWRIFLEELLDRNSPASDTLRSQAGALAAEMQSLSDTEPDNVALRRLCHVTQNIVIDRNEASVSSDATLDEKAMDALDCKDIIAAIFHLHQALLEDEQSSRWSHLPKALTLASLQEAVMDRGDNREKEELEAYLKALSKAKGSKGLIPLSKMLQLSQSEQHAECISLCIETFDCRDLEKLALLIDPVRFSSSSINEDYSKRLNENKYASYLGLKSLLYYCNDDFFKVNKVYQSWLNMISHHRGSLRETTAQSNEEVHNIYEESDHDYLFMGNFEFDADMQDYSDSILHRSPPNSKPTSYHFNLFLKMVPRAFAITAQYENASMKDLLNSSDYHEKTIELAFEIIKEMHIFQVEPTASTWSLLLTLMARNINAASSSSSLPSSFSTLLPLADTSEDSLHPITSDLTAVKSERVTRMDEKEEEDNEKQWQKIWNLTSALGMGPSHLHIGNSSLPKATALTYASLIYAFLKVPWHRGGPCLKEATQVKRWMLEDKEALRDVTRYKKPINRVLHFHRKIAKRHHENKNMVD